MALINYDSVLIFIQKRFVFLASSNSARIVKMGIMNGARSIIAQLPAGLYVRRPSEAYNIYVDGELIRYKGMIAENLTKSDAEMAIARTSYLYIQRLLKAVERHLGRRANRTIVYMDGARVANKVSDRPEFLFDASLIRSAFSAYCIDNGLEVRHLDYGESELQMYLMRDITSELNVLITADSDVLAIAYHHRARRVKRDGDASGDLSPSASTTSCSIEDSITDRNAAYPSNEEVMDSCLWVNCSSNGTAFYGMDELQDRMGYSPFAFRVFLALCGTDFTPQLFTDSMIDGVMNASTRDREFVNALTDVNETAAILVLLGLRGNGTIKRKESYDYETLTSQGLILWLEDTDKLVRNYITYIETGRMGAESVRRPKMSIISRFYLFAMRNGVDIYVRKNIQTWAKRETLDRALENYRCVVGHERAKMSSNDSCHFVQSLRLSENNTAQRRRCRSAISSDAKRARLAEDEKTETRRNGAEENAEESLTNVLEKVRKSYANERLTRMREQIE